MQIILTNVQAIAHAKYDLPDKGLVQILGPNSNGKSILMRAVEYVGKLRILNNEDRNSLIRDGEDEARILMGNNMRILDVHLHRDAQYCYVTLFRDVSDTKNPAKVVRRFFREGGIDELISEFGWCYYSKGNVCLQINEQYGTIPFVNSTPARDGELVEAVTTDTVAQEFIENFKDITYPKAKEQIKFLNEKVNSIKSAMDKLTLFDIVSYKNVVQSLKEIYQVLDAVKPISLVKLNIPPRVDLITIKGPLLRKLPIISVFPIMENTITSLSNSIRDIDTIMKGKCPTCGRLLCRCEEEVVDG